jgi:hypothetical protein
VALVKRPTPQAAIEISSHRSPPRIDVLTPSSIRIGSVSKPLLPPLIPPVTPSPVAGVPTKDRLAKSSSDVHEVAAPALSGVALGTEAMAGTSGATVSGESTSSASPRVSLRPAAGAWRRVAVAGVLVAALAGVFAAFELGRPLDMAPTPAVGPSQPSEVKIKFASAPAGAEVRLVGTTELLGVTPFTRSFPRGARTASFEFVKPGFATVTQEIGLAVDDAFAVALAPVAEPPVAPPVPAVLPAPAPTPKRNRPHGTISAKPSAPRASDQPLDRNGTIDVFKRP